MKKVQEIRFSRPTPGSCPAYKDYYIQDRFAGKDIYGNDAFEYALFKRVPFKVIRRFRTRKRAYEYVSNLTGFSRWDLSYRSCGIVVNDKEYLGVISNGTMYRITRRTREVATRPANDEQLTGWFMRYADCLEEAKQLIQEKGGVTSESVDNLE